MATTLVHVQDGVIKKVGTLTEDLVIDFVDYSDVTSERLCVFMEYFDNVEGVEDVILNYAIANEYSLLEKVGNEYHVLTHPEHVSIGINYF